MDLLIVCGFGGARRGAGTWRAGPTAQHLEDRHTLLAAHGMSCGVQSPTKERVFKEGTKMGEAPPRSCQAEYSNRFAIRDILIPENSKHSYR